MAINIPSMPIRPSRVNPDGGIRCKRTDRCADRRQSVRCNDCNLFDDERLVQILASPQFEAPRYVSTVAAQRQRHGHGGGESAGIEAKLSYSTFRWPDDGRQRFGPEGIGADFLTEATRCCNWIDTRHHNTFVPAGDEQLVCECLATNGRLCAPQLTHTGLLHTPTHCAADSSCCSGHDSWTRVSFGTWDPHQRQLARLQHTRPLLFVHTHAFSPATHTPRATPKREPNGRPPRGWRQASTWHFLAHVQKLSPLRRALGGRSLILGRRPPQRHPVPVPFDYTTAAEHFLFLFG